MPRQLGQPHRQLRVVELIALIHHRGAGIVRVDVAVVQEDGVRGAGARPGERIEIVTVADEHHRLAAMLGLLKVIQHVVDGLEGHVRAVHHFLRRFARGRLLDDFRRLQPASRDLVRRFLHPAAVVGEIDRNRRRAGRHDAEQPANARGVAELEMQIVDDKNNDAAGGVVDGPRRRQDDALTYGRGGDG